jgi:hypothetical protein
MTPLPTPATAAGMTLRRVVRARLAVSGASTECAPRPAASRIFVAPKPLARVVLYEDGTDFACPPVAAVWSPMPGRTAVWSRSTWVARGGWTR